MNQDIKKLIDICTENQRFSYAPYSQFIVSAVLETKSGEIFTGVNIENAAYTPTNCAERTAIFKAVSEGYRDFKRILVMGGPDFKCDEFIYPCGVCRQVMAEFDLSNDMEIISAKSDYSYMIYSLGELFPYGFGAEDLK
ncbi:MAG: cytidine deaminase [Tissierellia bacterium]|nr:cytidine deaminase [Tissierellia bacterium]